MEFSYSMDATPRVSIPANAPLFASVIGSVADLGGGECVFRTVDGQAHVMTHQVLQAMDRCRSFLSMAEHIQAVRHVIPSAPAEGIQRVLENLVARRLLVSEADFIAAMQASAGVVNNAPMRMLIRATDGGDAAARLLQSLAAATDWREQIAEVILLSTASATRSSTLLQSRLDAFAKTTGCRARVIPAEEQRTRLRRLLGADARASLSIESIVGTQGQVNAAQSFNLALSLIAGGRGLVLDEHMQWPLQRHAEFRRGLELRPVDQVSARFSAALAVPAAIGEAGSEGLLREHDLACGARLGSLLGGDRSSAWKLGDLRGVSLSEFLIDSGDCRIIGTITGARGSLRSMSVEDMFLLDAESRASFSADRDRYLAQLQRANVWTGTRRAALARRSSDLPLTLDASGFLPFALPGSSAAGTAFSGMLCMARPDAALLHLPDSIGYDDGARGAAEIGKQPLTPDFDRFVTDFLVTRAADIRAHTGAVRMRSAATMLRDLAEASPADLSAFTAEYLQYARSELIGRLQRAAEEAGTDAPVHWLADLRAIVTVNGRALVQSQLPQLLGDADADTGAFASRLAQRLLQTADAMEAWPALWDRLQDEASSAKGRSE
jgi:hypothetical protein